MNYREITDCALLVGFDPNGTCVYSSQMPLSDYWNGEHIWDTSAGVIDLHLVRLHGYLFDSSGELLQEFTSFFDTRTGLFKSGWQKHSDGSYQEHSA